MQKYKSQTQNQIASSWICCHFKRDIDFCNFITIFGFQELENCNKTDLTNCFLLNARFLIYRPRCKIEKTKPNVMLFISTINSQKNQNIQLPNVMGICKNIFENKISIELNCYCTSIICFTTVFYNDIIITIIFMLISFYNFL